MTNTLRVKEIERDESLGIIKKEITLTNGISFTSPSRGIKQIKKHSYLEDSTKVQEIVKQIDDKTLNILDGKDGATSRIAKEIKKKYRNNALNLVIFNLIFKEIPNNDKLDTLAQHLYSSSENTIILPTVKTALFKEDKKIVDNKFADYLQMIKFILDKIQNVGNSKAIIGTVPLLVPKYSRQIVNFYLDQGINAFAIDANTGNLISREADTRAILSTINTRTPLNETFIYACNLGYPDFEQNKTRADDFLSFFSYIDVMGGKFKTKGFTATNTDNPSTTRPEPKLKEFSADLYAYQILPPKSYEIKELNNKNQVEQLKEANLLQELIGEEKIEAYIQKKTDVDSKTITRLKKTADNIKIK